MKIFFTLIALLSISDLFAARGIILVLEAPLLREASLNSQVVQTTRRGDKIFIHDKHFHASPWESTANASENLKIVAQDSDEEFYQTISNDGGVAYVQAKYVKIIYRDSREMSDPVTRFKVDPTDYRLEEPLPEGYPLSEREKKKAAAFFTFGTHTKASYPFAGTLSNEKFHKTLGLQVLYTTKVSYDLLDRFYFGAKLGFDNNDVELEINNTINVKQSIGRFHAGPYISYDLYKTQDHRFTTYGHLALTYNRAYLTYDNRVVEEERAFSAWSLTPEVGAQWQWLEVFPHTDLVLGSSIVMQPTVELTSSVSSDASYWNQDQDALTLNSGLRAMFLLGIQSRY